MAGRANIPTNSSALIAIIADEVANMIRFLVDGYNKPVPAILEIPSKDHPYDPAHDSSAYCGIAKNLAQLEHLVPREANMEGYNRFSEARVQRPLRPPPPRSWIRNAPPAGELVAVVLTSSNSAWASALAVSCAACELELLLCLPARASSCCARRHGRSCNLEISCSAHRVAPQLQLGKLELLLRRP
nr:unnamed protein product [Digitaria exilis]